ncbi:MAG: alanine racemase, partial [Puniceicoccales bacterium]
MENVSKSILQKLDTPALLVDWKQVEANVRGMGSLAEEKGVRWMPHIKTHKSVAIAKMQLEAGAYGLTCAKISEGRALLPSGVKRLFVAHSVVSPVKIPALLELADRLDELIVAITSIHQARRLAELLKPTGRVFPCLLAVDTGMGREGSRNDVELVRMKLFVDGAPSLEYRGIYTHEGFTYTAEPGEIRGEAVRVAQSMLAARGSLGGVGEIWPGCSVTAKEMIGLPGITGVRPGAYVFADLFLTQMTGAMRWEDISLAVAAMVVDKPAPGLALIDAGSKVFSSDRLAEHPFAIPLDGRRFAVTRLREEHGFLTGEDVD